MKVELCISRLEDIKFIFKFVCKRSDRLTMRLLSQGVTYNEIDQYQDPQDVSASGAVWILFALEIVKHHHSVADLDVHLCGQRTV